MSGAASPLEISWSVIAVAGLLFSGWLMLVGWLDWLAVEAAIRETPPRARRWGPRWYVAGSAVVANGMLCFVWAGFLTVGVIAMQFPPPPPNVEQSVYSVISGWVLIAMEAILVFVQAWHLWIRGRVEQSTRTTA